MLHPPVDSPSARTTGTTALPSPTLEMQQEGAALLLHQVSSVLRNQLIRAKARLCAKPRESMARSGGADGDAFLGCLKTQTWQN